MIFLCIMLIRRFEFQSSLPHRSLVGFGGPRGRCSREEPRSSADSRDLPPLLDPRRRPSSRRCDRVQMLSAHTHPGQSGKIVAGPERRNSRHDYLRSLAVYRGQKTRRLHVGLGWNIVPTVRTLADLDRR